MRGIKRFGAFALAVTISLAAAGCGSDESDDSASGGGSDAVTVGVIPIVDVAPIYLGEEQGFFDEVDIDLTLETAQGGAAIVPGVASGQFQFGFSNNTSLLLATSQGLPLKVVAAGNSTTGEIGNDFSAVMVPEGSEITDAAGLVGKTVAVNTLNNIGSTTINQAVRDAGGDPTTIDYVELAFPDMLAALAGGDIDAAWEVEPFVTISQAQGATPVVWNLVATDPALMISSYFTSTQQVESDADLVERFTAAMNKSLDYAEANPDAVREVLASYTQVDAETAAALVLPKFSSTLSPDSFDLLADLAIEDGVLDAKPDIASLVP